MIDNQKIIEILEKRISDFKDVAVELVSEVNNHLNQMRAETWLRPRIFANKGYVTFTICWRKFKFIHRDMLKQTSATTIRKGNAYLVPKRRLMIHCKGCADWEGEYIWEKEQEFARIRKHVALYSKAIMSLKQIEKELEEERQEKEASGW